MTLHTRIVLGFRYTSIPRFMPINLKTTYDIEFHGIVSFRDASTFPVFAGNSGILELPIKFPAFEQCRQIKNIYYYYFLFCRKSYPDLFNSVEIR